MKFINKLFLKFVQNLEEAGERTDQKVQYDEICFPSLQTN